MQKNVENEKVKIIKTDDINTRQILNILRMLIVIAFAIIGMIIGISLSDAVGGLY